MAVMDILTVKVKNSYDSSYIRDAKVAIDIVSPSGANPSHYESYTTSQGAPFRFQANSGPSSINITATYEGVTANAKNQSIIWSNDTTGQDARTASLEVLLYYKPTTSDKNLTIIINTLTDGELETLKLEKPQYIKLYYYKGWEDNPLKTIYTITETLPYVDGVTTMTIKRPWTDLGARTIIAISETRNTVNSKQHLLRGTTDWTSLQDDPLKSSIRLKPNRPQINTVIAVKNQFGIWISGANVSLTPLWSNDTVVTGTTNSNGIFTTNSDKPFTSVTVSKDGYFSTTENLDLNVLSQREVVILEKSYTVYGKCYKKNGLGTSAAEITINYKNGTSSKVTPNNSGDWTYTANNEIKNIACNVGYYNSAIYNYDENSIKRFDFITDLTEDLNENQIATKEHYAVLKDRNIHNDTTCQDWQCPTVADILTVTKLLISGDNTENRCPKYSEAQESYVTLTPSTTPLILNRDGLSPATVELTSNDSWTLDYGYKNKFTVTPTQGTGNATITIQPTGVNHENDEIVDSLTVTTSNNKQNHISFSQRKFETIILSNSSGSTGFTIPQSFVGKELYLSASETTAPTTNYLLGKITAINDQQVLVSTQNVTFDQVTSTSNALNSGELKEKNKIYIGVIDGTFTPLLAATGTNIGSEGFTFVSQALAHVSTQSWNGYAQATMSCEQAYSGPLTATWRIPFDWEKNIDTAHSDTSIPLRISPYPTYNEVTTNGKYIDLLCEYHAGANAGLDIIATSSAITELKQKLAGDWKYFDYLYFWTNGNIATNNVVKQLDGTTTIKIYEKFMLFEIEMAAYKFDEGLNKLIAGQDFDMTDENNMNTDDAGSYITDGTKSMLYTNYIYFKGMLPVYNQTSSVVPVGFGTSLTDGGSNNMFNITSIGGKSTEGWVYDNQYAMSMIHINRAIGLENGLAGILDGFLVYVRDSAGEAWSGTTTKFIKFSASGSDSPVEYTIPTQSSDDFIEDSERRFLKFVPFNIDLDLRNLIQGEMTTVEISASGSGNYAIVVS